MANIRPFSIQWVLVHSVFGGRLTKAFAKGKQGQRA
jgi:hypothetical protein